MKNNADTEYDYLVTNTASVEEYTIVHIAEVSNANEATYNVTGDELRVVVPANTFDFVIPLNIHVEADSPAGLVQLTASNERIA